MLFDEPSKSFKKYFHDVEFDQFLTKRSHFLINPSGHYFKNIMYLFQVRFTDKCVRFTVM